MKSVIHRAKSRGHFDHGWVESWYNFSYAEYFDPQRVYFGALRVLNDDTIAPGNNGFRMHMHNNMEIICIPLEGEFEHRDDLGNQQTLGKGHVQVMSAGTGIRHSEYNKNSDKPVNFLQIGILPCRDGAEPRYQQVCFEDQLARNTLTEIVAPCPGSGRSAWIDQQAWLSLSRLDAGAELVYTLKAKDSYGVYLFVITGEVILNDDIELLPRDGMGVMEVDSFRLRALTGAEVLLIETPHLK